MRRTRIEHLRIFLLLIGAVSSMMAAGVGARLSLAAERQNDRQTIDIGLRDDVLTVHVHEAPLRDVLEAISEVTGFHLRLKGDLMTPTTENFSLTRVKAIKRIVGNRSLMMRFGKAEASGSHRLIAVTVYEHSEGREANGAVAASPTAEEAYAEEVCSDITRTEECILAQQLIHVGTRHRGSRRREGRPKIE